MDKPQTEDEARALIAELEGEARALKNQIAAWELAITEAKTRHRAIVGGWSRAGGLLGTARGNLARIQARNEYNQRPPVVWVGAAPGGDWRIVKVTPKRVYIATDGHSGIRREIMLRSTGWSLGSYKFGRIDVDACVAALESQG